MALDVFTFGETMLRLSPPGSQRLEQTAMLEMVFGGAESNVAVNLARMGRQVAWHSRLPDNPLGRQTAAAIRKQGVETDTVQFCPGERMGLYFIEYGVPPRGIQVWYDRANSAASRITPADLPREVIASSRWLHVTGITPALSTSAAETLQRAVNFALEQQITVSFDVNYRARLWQPAAAAQTLEPICHQADYVIVALRDAQSLWQMPPDPQETVQKLQRRWGGTVIVTCGDQGSYGCDGSTTVQVNAIPATIVDRIGAGDAFVSGVIHQLLDHASLEDSLRFGSALAALKLTIPGDMALVSLEEVQALLQNQQNHLRR